jgi:hypothetical protein
VRRNGKREESQSNGYTPVKRRALHWAPRPFCAFALKHWRWPKSVSRPPTKDWEPGFAKGLRHWPKASRGYRESRGKARQSRIVILAQGSLRTAPATAAARGGPRGLTKGSAGARPRDRPERRVAGPHRGGAAAQGAGWLLDIKRTAEPRAGRVGPRSAGMSTCLAGSALQKPHLSSLQLLLEKALGRNCVCAGRAAGWAGPGREAEGGQLVGGWGGG